MTDAALAADGQGSIPDPAIYPEVFEDDLHFGPLNTLRQFPSEEIEAIEFISATAATTRYGGGYLGGIIRVITRR